MLLFASVDDKDMHCGILVVNDLSNYEFTI